MTMYIRFIYARRRFVTMAEMRHGLAPVLGTDRSRVLLPSVFYLLKKAKNVMDAKNYNFHFFAFFKSFSVR